MLRCVQASASHDADRRYFGECDTRGHWGQGADYPVLNKASEKQAFRFRPSLSPFGLLPPPPETCRSFVPSNDKVKRERSGPTAKACHRAFGDGKEGYLVNECLSTLSRVIVAEQALRELLRHECVCAGLLNPFKLRLLRIRL